MADATMSIELIDEVSVVIAQLTEAIERSDEDSPMRAVIADLSFEDIVELTSGPGLIMAKPTTKALALLAEFEAAWPVTERETTSS